MIMALLTATSQAQLRDGETIVFLGDSITEAGAGDNGYITLFRQAMEKSRPGSGIRIIGAGISGHKVPDLEARLDRDVLSQKPQVVVIYIGINDVWHSENGNGTDAGRYEQGLKNLIRRCRDAGARVVLATPSVIGEKSDGSNKLDAMLHQYAEISRRTAAEGGAVLLDLRQAFVEHLSAYNLAGADHGILTSDGVHLNEAGNRFVAVRMLEAVGEISPRRKVLRHVVLFRFQPNLQAAQIDEINVAFHRLQHAIPEIRDFERGTNNSPEKLDKGFTHAYVISFSSEEDRAAYLPHAAHQKFVELIGNKLADVLVFDYWAIE